MKKYIIIFLFSIAMGIFNCCGNQLPDPLPNRPTVPADTVTIHFERQIAESSYLLFGGCSPVPEDKAAWVELTKAGVTFLRFDVKLGVYPEPKQITLEDYKANQGKAGTIADINSNHWDFSRLEGQLSLAKENGLKTLVILNYCPKWLSYNGDIKSPPKDWDVWEDIVKQIVRKYKSQVDYWEIWNEPNGTEFLKTNGSPYPETRDGMLQAYIDITRHTIKAAREADPNAYLGGPSLATWDSQSFFEKYCATVPLDNLDFLSYHIYWHTPEPHRPYINKMFDIAREQGAGQKPHFISEWNSQSSVDEKYHEFKNTPEAVGWIGKTFALYLNQGIKGSCFYNMHEGKAIDDGFGGAYKMMNNGEVQLFRYIKVFHLLSKVLDLGRPEGVVRVYDSKVAGQAAEETLPPLFVNSIYTSACINSQGIPVIILANPSDGSREISLAVKGLNGSDCRLNAFFAGPEHAGPAILEATSLFNRTQSITNGNFETKVTVAPHSVVGIRIEPK